MATAVSSTKLTELSRHALETRRDIVRMAYAAKSGHPGGSLSVTDLVVALVFEELHLDPARPSWLNGDRLVLSNGYAAPALSSALGHRGYLPLEEPGSLRPDRSRLPGQVDRRRLPGVESATGCAGQGLGMAIGMALDNRLARRTSRVFAMLGDGECEAGPTWEALVAGARYQLDHLVVLLDRHGGPADRAPPTPTGIEPIADQLRAFRYETIEIDGHDFGAILGAFSRARESRGRPTAILADTVPGKGVSFMEHQPSSQGNSPTRVEAEQALAELGASL
jgi:transketolase